jgi:predicted O-methyltransferase YrrM
MNNKIKWLLHNGEGPNSRHILRLNRAEAKLLWHYAENAKLRMVEIGRCYGGSACLMSAASPNIMLDSIDLTIKLHEECVKYLRNKNVSLRIANSNTFQFTSMYDLAFIDGDHSYEGVKNDFENLMPNLTHNAIILFHDAVSGAYGTCEGVQKFTKELIDDGIVLWLEEADSMLAVKLLK